MVSVKSSSGEMSCAEARRLLVDYMEGDLARAIAWSLLTHLESCAQCESVLKGLQNVTDLLGHLAEFDLPAELRFTRDSGSGHTGSSI
jgi:hypothetical protein